MTETSQDPAATAAESTGSDLIWPREDILRRLRHRDADVRAWALSRLAALDPAEAVRAGLAALDDESPEVQGRALDVLDADPPTEDRGRIVAALARCARDSRRLEGLRMTAIHLLGRPGGPEARAALEGLRDEGSVAQRAQAWRALAAADPEGTRSVLLARLAGSCSGDLGAALVATLIVVARPEDAAFLLDAILRKVPSSFRESLVGGLMVHAGAEDAWAHVAGREGSLFAGLEGDLLPERRWKGLEAAFASLSWARVIDGAAGVFASLPPRAENGSTWGEITAWSSALLKALTRRTGVGRTEAGMAAALAWGETRNRVAEDLCLAGAPGASLVRLRESLPERVERLLNERVVARWAGPEAERDGIRQALLEELRPVTPPHRRRRAARLAAMLAGFPAARAILGSIGEDSWEDAATGAIRFLSGRPAEVRPLAEEYLYSSRPPQALALLEVLGNLGRRWGARAVLDRWDDLMRTPFWDLAWESLEELADPESLRFLVEEWRPGEISRARAIDFIARVCGEEEKVPAAIRREAAEVRRLLERFRSKAARARTPADIPALTVERPLKLDLRCGRCGRTYTYEVDEVWIDPEHGDDWDGTVLLQVMVCKKCGAEDDYELTGRAHLWLASWLEKIRASGRPADSSSPVQFGKLVLWDGTQVRRPSQGTAHLRRAIAAEPGRGELWRRLGNHCRRIGRPREAEEAYRKAVEVDPGELEARYGLAILLLEQGRPEAGTCVVRAIEAVPLSKADRGVRRNVAREMVGALREILSVSGEPLALHAAWLGGKAGPDQVVNLSGVDLRSLRDWDALAEFVANDRVQGVTIDRDVPQERPTILEGLLGSMRGAAGTVSAPPPAGKLGRNAPCPCGSGKKYKRCCSK